MRSRSPLPFLFVLVTALAVTAVGCPCVRGPVNSSDSLRWWLFSSFGASKVCPEMLKRGVPLKIASMGPSTIGRFFPRDCQVQVSDADHTMALSVNGVGYAFVPFARRIGFSATTRIEIRPDFRLESDATYVWGRFSRVLAGPTLQLLGVENALANAATKTPLGDMATSVGQGIATGELSRGFTIVQTDDGDDFALGILSPPERPARALQPGGDHKLLASDTAEIHASEREYFGPFAIESSGQALYVKLRVAGAPVNVFLVDKGTGDLWMQSYLAAQPLGPPPGPTIASGIANLGDSTQFSALEPGLYYVVVENRALPAPTPLGIPIPMPEVVATVTYAAEVGDRPLAGLPGDDRADRVRLAGTEEAELDAEAVGHRPANDRRHLGRAEAGEDELHRDLRRKWGRGAGDDEHPADADVAARAPKAAAVGGDDFDLGHERTASVLTLLLQGNLL